MNTHYGVLGLLINNHIKYKYINEKHLFII